MRVGRGYTWRKTRAGWKWRYLREDEQWVWEGNYWQLKKCIPQRFRRFFQARRSSTRAPSDHRSSDTFDSLLTEHIPEGVEDPPRLIEPTVYVDDLLLKQEEDEQQALLDALQPEDDESDSNEGEASATETAEIDQGTQLLTYEPMDMRGVMPVEEPEEEGAPSGPGATQVHDASLPASARGSVLTVEHPDISRQPEEDEEADVGEPTGAERPTALTVEQLHLITLNALLQTNDNLRQITHALEELNKGIKTIETAYIAGLSSHETLLNAITVQSTHIGLLARRLGGLPEVSVHIVD